MREDNRHLYGRLIGLSEFISAYESGGGFCRGCGHYKAGVPVKARGMECPNCRERRVFSAREFARNGWVAEVPLGRYKSFEAFLADVRLTEIRPEVVASFKADTTRVGEQK